MVPLQSSFAKPQTPTDVGKLLASHFLTAVASLHCRSSSAQGGGVVVLCPRAQRTSCTLLGFILQWLIGLHIGELWPMRTYEEFFLLSYSYCR